MRQEFINYLRCYDCDEELTSDEVELYAEYDGMCECCYSIAMKAAYEDLTEFDKDYFDLNSPSEE